MRFSSAMPKRLYVCSGSHETRSLNRPNHLDTPLSFASKSDSQEPVLGDVYARRLIARLAGAVKT